MSIGFAIKRQTALLRALTTADECGRETFAYQIQQHAERRADCVFLRYEDQEFTYAEANSQINKHAYAYKLLGVGEADVVAIVMENRPEYLFHVYALHKLGAVASLINSHVSGDVLAHAIRVCEPKQVVVGSEVWAQFEGIRGDLGDLTAAQVHIDSDSENPAKQGEATFQDRLVDASDANPPECGTLPLSALAAYIYTSGTTGMPKAARVTHYRMWRAGAVWSGAGLRFRDGDVMYNCLPLYHSNGFILATGSVISGGVSMALARKFSTRRFWDDVRKHRATSFIYIGELCRYLMNAPATDSDKDHQVRAITGNGLRPDIWRPFQERFGIGRVAEFYAATEGNCITLNFANREGSVGPLMPGMALAKWDDDADDFVRGADGFLVKASRGDTGVLLGKIRPKAMFDGYNDKAETEKKVIRNAFVPGDAYFNSGDLIRWGRDYHLYFADRLGDTFRWKGENVATFEVQEQLTKHPEIAEANVYGVQIEGADGRAGMASLVLSNGNEFDPKSFQQHVDSSLPSYARPLFVRIQSVLDTTATMKLKKNELKKQAFDPSKCVGEAVWFRSPEAKGFVPMDQELYQKVQSGAFRL